MCKSLRMTNRIRARVVAGLLFTVTLVMVGCSGPSSWDGVLWRQIATQKSALSDQLREPLIHLWSREQLSEAVIADDVESAWTYWEGDDHPLDPSLTGGGVVLYDLRERRREDGGHDTVFGVLLFSGPRNVEADSVARSKDEAAYFGPASIYTCEEVVVQYVDDTVQRVDMARAWGDVAACPTALVNLLGSDARYVAPAEFDG